METLRGTPFPLFVEGLPGSASDRTHSIRLPLAIRWFVLLLSRPPYLRWLAAGALVAAALGWEISDRRTESFPFAAHDLERGRPIEADDIEWRYVPSDLLSAPALEDGWLVQSVRAGDPITAAVVTPDDPVPGDWWSIPMPLPPGVAPGSRVRLVLDDGRSMDGIVAIEAHEDAFGLQGAGAVAVPPESADAVARAAAASAVTVLLRP